LAAALLSFLPEGSKVLERVSTCCGTLPDPSPNTARALRSAHLNHWVYVHSSDLSSGSSTVALEHFSTGSSLVDVFDRVMDKGIVIDGQGRPSTVGLSLLILDIRLVVASREVHLDHTAVPASATERL